jgi:hypothetical protein
VGCLELTCTRQTLAACGQFATKQFEQENHKPYRSDDWRRNVCGQTAGVICVEISYVCVVSVIKVADYTHCVKDDQDENQHVKKPAVLFFVLVLIFILQKTIDVHKDEENHKDAHPRLIEHEKNSGLSVEMMGKRKHQHEEEKNEGYSVFTPFKEFRVYAKHCKREKNKYMARYIKPIFIFHCYTLCNIKYSTPSNEARLDILA